MSQSGLGRSADVEIFCTKRAARALRVVEVDAWPLYTLVQWSIAQAGMNELCAVESFGRVHVFEVGALLGDLASCLASTYLNSVAERFGCLIKETIQGKVTTRTLMIKEPELIGEYLAFERVMPSHTGVGALRYALGRSSNTDAMFVAPLLLYYCAYTSRVLVLHILIVLHILLGLCIYLTDCSIRPQSRFDMPQTGRSSEQWSAVYTFVRRCSPISFLWSVSSARRLLVMPSAIRVCQHKSVFDSLPSFRSTATTRGGTSLMSKRRSQSKPKLT